MRIAASLQSYSFECDEAFRQEIIGMCDRSQQVITQLVPVIEQRNRYEKERDDARRAMDEQAELQNQSDMLIGSYWKLELERDTLRAENRDLTELLQREWENVATLRESLAAPQPATAKEATMRRPYAICPRCDCRIDTIGLCGCDNIQL